MSNDVGIAIAWRRLVAGGALVVAGICGLGAQAGVAQGAPGAASYTEDFSITDRFRRDSVAESGLKVFLKLGLSSARPPGGEVLYDLQKLLPGWTKDSIVVLTYEGGGDVGNQMIGVRCDSGPSTDQLAEFSKAACGKPLFVRGRYLRFRIAWQQTAGPEYGLLRSFSVRFGTPADVPIPIAFTLDKPGMGQRRGSLTQQCLACLPARRGPIPRDAAQGRQQRPGQDLPGRRRLGFLLARDRPLRISAARQRPGAVRQGRHRRLG